MKEVEPKGTPRIMMPSRGGGGGGGIGREDKLKK